MPGISWKVAFLFCFQMLEILSQLDQQLLKYRVLNIGGGGEYFV